jgi:AraC family transcriptional regulator of adaptative response/methylated-DNA-[protein]-cysteine methyltransferase
MSNQLDIENCWQAVCDRDASQDGRFYFAVKSTGVYCKPSCPARRPLRANVTFYPSPDAAAQAGFRACRRCRPTEPDWVSDACRFLEQHAAEDVALKDLAARFQLTTFHLQRTFKRKTGLSPREYQAALRARLLKSELRESQSVTDAVYAAGYSAPSRMYEAAAATVAMTPKQYRSGGQDVALRYQIISTRIGWMLVAATQRGVAMVHFADTEAELLAALQAEYPQATLSESSDLGTWVDLLRQSVEGALPSVAIPLDVQATAFQKQVWKQLQAIPAGQTRSYQQVAAAMGQPSATRAVARACATNPTAIAVPCHRVVRADGGLGGYRWGMGRKRALLDAEKELS